MRFSKYWSFRDDKLLNENVAQAKKLARELYQVNKVVTRLDSKFKTSEDGLMLHDSDGYPIAQKDLPTDLINKAKEILNTDPNELDKREKVEITKDELEKAERAGAIEDVKKLVGKKQGYVYMFLYFKLVEKVGDEDLKYMFDRLQKNADLLQRLSRNITNYIDQDSEKPNFEQLEDDLENIEMYRKSKKFINEFPSSMKAEYDKAGPYIKGELAKIAVEFDNLGMVDGVMNKGRRKAIQKRFYSKISAYPNLEAMVKGAKNFIKAEGNAGYSKFIEAIYRTKRFGADHAAELLFDENEVIIFELKSFAATQELCGSTSWCIKNSLHYWNQWAGGETVYNKQYVIVNFNLDSSDDLSFIGTTIGPNKSVETTHDKRDHFISENNLRSILSRFEVDHDLPDPGCLWELLEPMTPEEIDAKKRRVSANRNIVKSNITLDELKQYHEEDGGDINAQNGQPLENAIDEDDVEKVKYLLDNGAVATLKTGFDSCINKSRSFPVLKLLIDNGAVLTRHAFRAVLDDMEAVKFCVENGMDPDLGGGMPIRCAIKMGNIDMVKLLVDAGAVEGRSDGKLMRIALQWERMDIVQYLLDNGYNIDINKSMDWMGVCKTNIREPERRYEILKMCQKWVDEGRAEMGPGPFKLRGSDGSSYKLTHEDIKEKWGSYMGYVLHKHPELDPKNHGDESSE